MAAELTTIDEDRYLRTAGIACILLAVAFVALTIGDVLSTLAGLHKGNVAELNPLVAHPDGGIRLGFLALSNTVLLVPLLLAFATGVARADSVPRAVLEHWHRHIFDIFYVRPLDDAARARAPLRLVTAAMTLFALKSMVLVSNLLAFANLDNPVSAAAALWTRVGLDGAARYWAAYAVLAVPCYVVGVGLAAAILRRVLRPAAA